MHNDPRYAAVNERQYPPLTRAASFKAARNLLMKLGAPRHCAVQGIDDLTGNAMFPARRVLVRIFERYCPPNRHNFGRTCWAASKPTTGHDKGWGRLIHDVSHMLQEYRHPSERPHGGSHPGIEREVADCVDRNGMIEVYSSKSMTRDRAAERLELLAHKRELYARWDAKERRARRAKQKLLRQISAIKRRIGDMSI